MSIIYSSAVGATKYVPSYRMQDGGYVMSFKTLGAMLASSAKRIGAESIWEAGGLYYREAALTALDHHLTTAGGVKLYVIPLYGPDLPLYPLSAFGAALDGVTDDTTAWKTALQAIQDGGGGGLLIRGIARVTEHVSITDWSKDVTLMGTDADNDGIHLTVSDTRIIKGTAAAPINLRLENVQLRGNWAADPRESPEEAWLIDVFGLRSLFAINCKFTSSQKGLVKARAEESAEAWYCTFEEAARDGWNMTGSRNTKFIGNTVRHVRDDAVALHVYVGATDSSIGQHIVSNNYFQDCSGIAALGARNLLVANNVGVLMRTRFCSIGVDPFWGEGYLTPLNVLVEGNVIQDLLDASFFEGESANHQFYTYVFPVTPSDGGVLEGIPGEPAAGGGIVPLYGNLDGAGEGSYFAPAQAVTIRNNKFMRTREAGVSYSSYGFGQYLTPTGYADGTPSDAHLNAECRFRSGIRDFAFTDNFIQGVKYGLVFDFANDSAFRNGRVSGNTFRDTRSNCIVTSAPGAGNVLDVRFDDNTIDGDPFYLAPGRGQDGSFAAAEDMTAFHLTNCIGWQGQGNRVFNCSQVERATGSVRNWSGRNYQYGQCSSAGFSTGNRGIGLPAEAAKDWWLIDYDADTTSPTWGQIATNVEFSNTQPETGYWLQGMFVRNKGSDRYIPDGNGMLLEGWVRRSTGNAHVAQTDWLPVYQATQSAL